MAWLFAPGDVDRALGTHAVRESSHHVEREWALTFTPAPRHANRRCTHRRAKPEGIRHTGDPVRLLDQVQNGRFVGVSLDAHQNSIAKQIYAGTRGHLDRHAVADIRSYESELYAFLETRHAQVLATLSYGKRIDMQLASALDAALEEFDAGRRTAGLAAAA